MLERISVSLQTYYDTAIGAMNILEKGLAQVRETYIGAVLAEKTKELQDVYNETLKESRETNYGVCTEVLNGIDELVQEILKVPVPADFIATLEALKQINNPSKAEIETAVGAYRNNYYAYRAICDYLKTEKPVTVDDILEDVSYIRSNVYECFYSDNLDGYHFLNWKDGTLMSTFDEKFTAFCDGRFEDIDILNPDIK